MADDIDLLFGTLAVEAGFISASQLQAAYEVFRDAGAASLAQVLLDQRLITTRARTEIEELVRIRLD